jgi:hypothetical protein
LRAKHATTQSNESIHFLLDREDPLPSLGKLWRFHVQSTRIEPLQTTDDHHHSHDPTSALLDWHKSSHSSGGCACVEVLIQDSSVFIRDTKDLHKGHNLVARPMVSCSTEDWDVFCESLRRDEMPAIGQSIRLILHPDGNYELTAAEETSLNFTHAEIEAFRFGVKDGEFSVPLPS